MNIVPSSYEKVKTTAHACYAAPLGKILLGFTALGVTAASANNALETQEMTAKASHAALGVLGILSTVFLVKEFNHAHGEDLRELRNVLAR